MSGAMDLAVLQAAIKAAAPGADMSVWLHHINDATIKCGATSPKRVAAFLGQCSVEAGPDFKEAEESLYYTHPERILSVWPVTFKGVDPTPYLHNPQALANFAYANRMGNGDVASGDGWRFRGGGLLQLTGRKEYTDYALTRGMSVDAASDFIRTPQGAADAAAWYWTANGLNDLADAWMITAITRRINGPRLMDNDKRIAASNAALNAISQ